MKSIVYSLLAGYILVSGFSCYSKCDCDETSQFEYLVFGHFYGECGGEGCVETFKIEYEQLFEDTLDQYPDFSQSPARSYIKLPAAKYELVKDLVDQFPEGLYSETDHVLGQPDAGDWGGIYVEIKHVNDPAHSGFWLLDQMESNMPQVYNDFVDKINEKISLINQ